MSDSTDVVEIKQVVELLRQPPFNRNESLVAFSSKNGLELLSVVNDVFTELDERHRKDLRTEGTEAMTARMLDFLTTLNYKIPGDPASFGEAFIRGSSTVIYPLLYWMLTRLDSLKKRAYLGRFLRPVEVPEEYFADDAIIGVFGSYKSRQAEFVELHKSYDAALSTALNPAELEKEVKQLELEREQLTAKLAKLNTKVKTDVEFSHLDFNAMLTITNLLRQAQEEEARLFQQAGEQKQRVQRSEHLKQQAANKLAEMQSNSVLKAEPAKLLNKLRFEVSDKKSESEGKLESSIKECEKQVRALEKVLSGETMSEDQVMELEHEVANLRSHVAQLSSKRDAQNSANGDKIGFFRERANAAEKKKDKLYEQLADLNNEEKEALEEIEKLNKDLSLAKPKNQPTNRPTNDAEMKAYMQQLTSKTTQYKEMKALLESLKAENGTLARTEEILKSRDTNLAEINAELEAARGVAGFSSTSAALETVSQSKQAVDASKGETLDEMSRIVENMGAAIESKKQTMAPQIKQLRTVRQKCDEMEAIYLEKKKLHDNIALGFESDRVKLEQDVNNNASGVAEEESSYHFLSHLLQIEQAKRSRINNEEKFLRGEGKLSSEFASYKDMFDKAVLDQEKFARDLRNAKKDVTANHDAHVLQRGMFINLQKLLSKKLELTQMLRQNAQNPNDLGIMAGMEMGSDRLVME